MGGGTRSPPLGKRKADGLGKEWELGNSCLAALMFPAKRDSQAVLRGSACPRTERLTESLSPSASVVCWGAEQPCGHAETLQTAAVPWGPIGVIPTSVLSCSVALHKARNLSVLLNGRFNAHPSCLTALLWVPQDSHEAAL